MKSGCLCVDFLYGISIYIFCHSSGCAVLMKAKNKKPETHWPLASVSAAPHIFCAHTIFYKVGDKHKDRWPEFVW